MRHFSVQPTKLGIFVDNCKISEQNQRNSDSELLIEAKWWYEHLANCGGLNSEQTVTQMKNILKFWVLIDEVLLPLQRFI